MWTRFLACVFSKFLSQVTVVTYKFMQILHNICVIINMCTDIAILNSHNQTDTMSFFKNKLKSK